MSNGGGNDSGQHQPSPLGDAYAHASTPDRFTAWIRDRTIGTRCNLTIHGAPATITSASTNRTAIDATAELRCWEQLRAAVHAALNGDTETAAAMLPPEVAAAEWVHHGQRTRIHQPGAATRALRCARRGLKALTPLPPLLGALSQPLAGGATAAGILFAPIPLPSLDEPPPFSMAVPGRTLHGEIDRSAPGSVADAHPTAPALGSGAPLLPAILPRSTLFPAPGDSTEPDAAPTPAPADTTPAPVSQRSAPALALTPTSTPTATPTPSPTGILDAASPSPSPSPTTTDAPTVKPTVSPSPVVTRSLKHLPHRMHHKHLLRRGLRHW